MKKEKKTFKKADLATVSHYIELEQKRQRIEKSTHELLNEQHEFIKEHEITVEKNEFFIKCIEKENDEKIRNLFEKDLQEYKKTNENINKRIDETKINYLGTMKELKDLKKIKIEMAKEYYEMGVDIDILTRYANLTSKEIKQIKEID